MTFEAGATDGWRRRLGEERFARALAAAGVLIAVVTSRQAKRNPGPRPMPLSAVDLLRDLLDAIVEEESPLLRWELSDEGLLPNLSWMPAPEVLDEVWYRALNARERWSGQRVVANNLIGRRNLPAKTGFRLQIPAYFDPLDEALSMLVNPYTGIESVSTVLPRISPRPQWNWPIKLRVLSVPGVDESAVEEFGRNFFIVQFELPDHVQLLSERHSDRADFALIFAASESACAGLLDSAAAESVNSDCLIVTTPADTFTLGQQLNRQLGNLKATGFVYQPGLRETSTTGVLWAAEFIRELSHAVTVDVAAMRAAEREKLRRPTIQLSRAFLEHAHLIRRQEMIISRLDEVAPPDVISAVPRATLRTLGVDSTDSVPAFTQALKDRLSVLDFNRESDDASIIAELSLAIDQLPRRLVLRFQDSESVIGFSPAGRESLPALVTHDPRPEEVSRFLQAQLLRVHGGRLKEHFKYLEQFGQCFVRVRIGIEDERWLGFGGRFPTDLLSPTRDGWELQVFVFTNVEEPPQTMPLCLPTTGSTEAIEFRCAVGDASQSFKARIVVAHANRVLQSAWLEAPVKGPLGKARGVFARGLEMEVKQSLTGLGERSNFGAFIVVNDSLTNVPGVAIASGHSAALRKPNDLAKAIDYFDGELSKISSNPEDYGGGLHSIAVVGMLRNLAQHGRLLYAMVVLDSEVDAALISAERVQVVAAEPDSRLPIEFFYDLPPPDSDASLCPGATACLRGPTVASASPCNQACPSGGATRKIICPRGFWGLRKVIEWHRHGGQKAQDGPFRLLSEPNSQRKAIKAFESVLFAHSDRVDAHNAQASADVLEALKFAAVRTSTANDWDIWRAEISSASPLLMVVLPHNEESQNTIPELSIGSGEHLIHRLLLSSIDDTIVKGPETAPGSIVMLLGCETGVAKVSYLDYVSQFRRGGASIIVSTGATVLGRHISPICVQLVKGLKAELESGPVPLGEVMLRLRRNALADGFPIVLALSAAGDADWLIE